MLLAPGVGRGRGCALGMGAVLTSSRAEYRDGVVGIIISEVGIGGGWVEVWDSGAGFRDAWSEGAVPEGRGVGSEGRWAELKGGGKVVGGL